MTEHTAQTVPLTLWAACLAGRPLEDRLAAAVAGGFASVSLFPFEIRRALETGLTPEGLGAMFADAGVPVSAVEPIAHWLPDSVIPESLPDDDPAAGAFRPQEVFAQAEAIGADLITLIAVYDAHVDPETGAEAFAALCDDAAEHGLRLQLEFIPGTGIGDLAHAWEIVRLADRPNGGMLLDSWHFFRSGSDAGLLGSLAPEKVFGVQLEDASLQAPADVAWESLHARLLPGEGELDLTGFLAPVLGRGVSAAIGPEVFNDSLREVDAAELGRRLAGATRSALAGAWPGGLA